MTHSSQPSQCDSYGPQVQPPNCRRGVIVVGLMIVVLVMGGCGSQAANDDGASSPTEQVSQSSGAGALSDGGNPGGEEAASAVARNYVEAINSKDEAAATALMCSTSDSGILYELAENDVQVEIIEIDMNVDTAVVYYRAPGGNTTGFFNVENNDGAWCIAF